MLLSCNFFGQIVFTKWKQVQENILKIIFSLIVQLSFIYQIINE